MKKIVILGAGTAGTILANHLRGRAPRDWSVQVVDPAPEHLYQPDLLFIAFGSQNGNTGKSSLKPRAATLRRGVEWVRKAVAKVDLDARQVILEGDARLDYDVLVISSGSHLRPEETEGLLGPHWHRSVFDFYTLEGARKLNAALDAFDGGRFVVNVVEMPIKCPVAPIEFTFLADEYFTRRGIRDRVEITYATPLDGAFTKPIASAAMGHLLEEKGIHVETEFSTGEVDGESRVLRSWDEREIGYDLLVSVPTHGGAAFVEASGLGNELGFVPTHKHSLLAKGHDNIFVMGDATDLPSSKAGSVAHFQGDVVAENVLRAIHRRSLLESFDGHSNCFVESGWGKALLVDFNYDVEPLPGHYPVPALGPFTLLKESRRNHWGKLAFRWAYWNAILPARPLPITNHMPMAGKKQPAGALAAA